MVLIYTNENNPATLKLIIAKNVAKRTVELKIVNTNDSSIPQPKHLPYVEIDNQQTLFTVNSAICYFVPINGENFEEVYNLLEWEATGLSPQLSHLLGGSSKNEKLKSSVLSALQFFNENLQNKNFLVKNCLTAADIAIWGTLYPLSICPKNSKEYLSKYVNIVNWIASLGNHPDFKAAVDSYKLDPSSAYNALLVGAKYLSISDEAEKQKEIPSPQQEKEAPVEAVSPEEVEKCKKSWQKSIKDLPKLKNHKGPIMPVPGEKNVLITSALPYVNNVPHLGNIIGCVLSADVFARFSRLCNNNTVYICGTDEYGTATETKALEEGLSCREICDKYHKIHKEIYEWFNISFDYFGRTSEPQQTQIVQDMFFTLNSNGFMFTQSVEQLHCEKCNKFLADRFVEGGCPNVGCNYEDARGDQCDGCGKLVNAVELKNPRCKICNNTPALKCSDQFYIDLPKLEPLLYHWIKLRNSGWSHNSQVIAKAWLKEGLKPRCITRDLKWGVPVPLDGYRDKVFYVWFDAPLGYISITKAYTEDYARWWTPTKGEEVTLYQFMAKDNVPFHSVLFPAMLLGANQGYITVNHLMATEYLNYEDGKFSKSRGVGVFGTDAQSTGIPSDVWRFYLLYVRPESQDSSFSWNDLVTKNNSELLNNLGNFINRALVFAKNNFKGTVPAIKPTEEDFNLLALCTRELKGYVEALEKSKLRDGIRHILSISRLGNQYMQSNQPWVLLKGSDDEKVRAGTVIGMCCNLSCLIATLLQPYMPETSENLKKQLNTSNIVLIPSDPEIVNMLPAGHKLGEPSPLFAKIEPSVAEELKKKFAGKQQSKETSPSGDFKSAADLEAAVASQGDKVRQLKSSGVEKSVWQPEVKILLDLKKQLESLKISSAPQSAPTKTDVVDSNAVQKIEEEVAKQALVVRTLKEGGAEKSKWQPEVDKLLALKKQLASASGTPVAAPQKSKKGKK
ncbi:methionine--tRNA ligase, cytoplasmic [Diabrotica virgifera virgifera]|uniref:Methionine--tRNA ligase, cytoplasmic n=2 Tax=Diabrotica virgifera virgifera TaxID=50390 RepID=A0A6P7FQR1_DIAVI|nr:methionine--tRNA ligase, cytoplasmic [Diabrotica virgifera virgifera]